MPSKEIFPGVVSDVDILGGKAIIKGTRMPVALILGHLASGMSIEELLEEYDLTLENISAALGYAAKRIEEEALHAK